MRRQTGRETDRQTRGHESFGVPLLKTKKQTNTKTKVRTRLIDRTEAERQTDKQNRHFSKQNRHKDTFQKNRHKDTQADKRQRHRQTDRQTQTDTEADGHTDGWAQKTDSSRIRALGLGLRVRV